MKTLSLTLTDRYLIYSALVSPNSPRTVEDMRMIDKIVSALKVGERDEINFRRINPSILLDVQFRADQIGAADLKDEDREVLQWAADMTAVEYQLDDAYVAFIRKTWEGLRMPAFGPFRKAILSLDDKLAPSKI